MNLFLRLTGLVAIYRRFVFQSRSTSAPFLDPRPRTRATRWFVLAFTDALRRSPAESSQIFEKLSLPCYRDRPARILPSLHSLGQFLVSPKIQFVVRDLSIFGTTLFTVFFQRVHSAYGLIRLPWRIVKNIYIYPLERREGHNWIGWPICMVRFLRSFSSPSSLCRHLLSTSTAV